MKSSAKKVELAPYDDLFSTEESRQDAKLEKIQEIPLSELHPFKGHTVPVYDLERTICDLLRSRNNMEMQTFQGALKMYARRKDKDLRTLMRYAGMFRVEKILRQYLEVLL